MSDGQGHTSINPEDGEWAEDWNEAWTQFDVLRVVPRETLQHVRLSMHGSYQWGNTQKDYKVTASNSCDRLLEATK